MAWVAAQARLVDLLFTHTTTRRVEALTELANVAERRALERAGLLREGITRGGQWRGGVYLDGVVHAALRDDPAAAACLIPVPRKHRALTPSDRF